MVTGADEAELQVLAELIEVLARGLRHGSGAASIAFLEIDDIGAFLKRHDASGADWKHPPAGLKKAAPGGSS